MCGVLICVKPFPWHAAFIGEKKIAPSAMAVSISSSSPYNEAVMAGGDDAGSPALLPMQPEWAHWFPAQPAPVPPQYHQRTAQCVLDCLCCTDPHHRRGSISVHNIPATVLTSFLHMLKEKRLIAIFFGESPCIVQWFVLFCLVCFTLINSNAWCSLSFAIHNSHYVSQRCTVLFKSLLSPVVLIISSFLK